MNAGTLLEKLAVALRASVVRGGAAPLAALVLGATTASALTIELKDVAPDRVERQRAEAEGRVPLPGTPDLTRLDERRTALGIAVGAPVLIRIFKTEMQLELWAKKDDRYVLFATYPICHFSGTLGPKLKEGDKQTPEGFYTVTMRQMHHVGRWPRSLNLGFPNVFDKAQKRDGSYILVHGGCSSVGCVAMTNGVNTEIYDLTMAALRGGQRHVPVHVFPFRLSDENLDQHRSSEWHGFWTNLKDGYRSFETTHLPPKVSVCNGRYLVEDGRAGEPVVEEPLPTRRGARRVLYRDRNVGGIQNACPAPSPELAAKNADGATAPAAVPQPPVNAASPAGSAPAAAEDRDIETGSAQSGDTAGNPTSADRVVEQNDGRTKR